MQKCFRAYAQCWTKCNNSPNRQMKSLRLLFPLLIPAAISAQTAPASPPLVPVALRAARMIDGNGGATIRNAVVIVTGDKITAAGTASTVTVPANARLVDLGDVTLLPGFIDSHVHIIGRTLGDPRKDLEQLRDFPGYSAILGVENARKTLMAGFTTVRVLGSPNFDDMALRQAISDGRAVGPRMQNAGHSLGITGGHCDSNGFRPGVATHTLQEGIANGPDEVRAAVRYQVKYGADVIKTCATGGVLSEGTQSALLSTPSRK